MIDLSLIAAQIREDVRNMEKKNKEVKEDEGTGKSPNTLQQK